MLVLRRECVQICLKSYGFHHTHRENHQQWQLVVSYLSTSQVTPALSLHYASRILQRSSRVHLKLSEAESSLELYRLSALRASLLPFLPAQNFKEVTLHLKQFLAQKGTRNQ